MHTFSCSTACGIFPDQGSNPCALHRQEASYPLHHQGSPSFLMILSEKSFGEWISLYHLTCYLHFDPDNKEDDSTQPGFDDTVLDCGGGFDDYFNHYHLFIPHDSGFCSWYRLQVFLKQIFVSKRMNCLKKKKYIYIIKWVPDISKAWRMVHGGET